ncbi:leptin receptor gene-related protein-like [Watersipora subatra]|uniref:leptin receptor gene-related protein-like n=1 Tax=Watersipora subatra TaxID=2589382 RepID=UPI00355C2A48
MAGVKAIIGLAFAAAIGITLLVVGCALYDNGWWAMFVLICYLLCPIPSLIARRTELTSDSSLLNEVCWFITAVIITSAYGLPTLLARTPLDGSVIDWRTAGFVYGGNTVVFFTILGFFMLFSNDDDFSYSGW